MWDIEEEEPPADPFKMLLPFCQVGQPVELGK